MIYQEIANHLWQSTLFAIAIGAISLLFRSDGAHVRYWLWWIASVKFLLPVSLLTLIGSKLSISQANGIVPESVTGTLTVVARPFSEDARLIAPETLLLAVWAAGTLLLIGRWLVCSFRLRQTLRNAVKDPVPFSDGRYQIAVYRSEDGMEPGVIGSFRPALVLPIGIEERLRPSQLEAVLAHELCHVRRRDNLTAAVHMLVESVFWFHPLVWWIGARLIDERERACDEAVVASGHDRKTYAASILNVCEHYVATPVRCAAGISGSDLKRRLTRIMRYRAMKHLTPAKKLLLSSAALLALVIPLFGCIGNQTTAIAQSPDYLPLVKVAPVFPPRAIADRIDGHVTLEYAVTEDGSVEDVSVVESSSPLFERPAVESALMYKYKPRLTNGVPQRVEGVRTRIIFEFGD